MTELLRPGAYSTMPSRLAGSSERLSPTSSATSGRCTPVLARAGITLTWCAAAQRLKRRACPVGDYVQTGPKPARSLARPGSRHAADDETLLAPIWRRSVRRPTRQTAQHTAPRPRVHKAARVPTGPIVVGHRRAFGRVYARTRVSSFSARRNQLAAAVIGR